MPDFKRKYMTDKLLRLLEYVTPNIVIKDCYGKHIAKGHIIVRNTIIDVLHRDTGFVVDNFQRYDIRAITYDVERDCATIQLGIGR